MKYELGHVLGQIRLETGTLLLSDPLLVQENWQRNGETQGVVVFGDDVLDLTDHFSLHRSADLCKNEYLIIFDEDCNEQTFLEKLKKLEKPIGYTRYTNGTFAKMRREFLMKEDKLFETANIRDQEEKTFGLAVELGYDGIYDVVLVRDERGRPLRIEINLQ